MTITDGSIELLSNGGEASEGFVVQTASPDQLPDALAILRGLGEFTVVEPPRAGVDREWTARTHDGFDVTVLFREMRLEGPRLAP